MEKAAGTRLHWQRLFHLWPTPADWHTLCNTKVNLFLPKLIQLNQPHYYIFFSHFISPQASTNKEIPPTETHPNLNEHIEEGNQVILNDQTGIFEEINRKNSKDTEKDNQIDNVVNNLLEALNENPSTKEEIMGYINQEEDIVDLEIDDWLTMDSWGNTPAIEEMIPIEFENL